MRARVDTPSALLYGTSPGSMLVGRAFSQASGFRV